MGHIKLAIPVAHTLFLREGKIATLLNNLPQKKLEQVISYDPEHAFNLLENYVTSFKTVSQEFHDYLVEVWNGSRDLKRSGFENKNYIIKRHADESEIAYMNYVVNKYPDEKENIFGRQKVI